MRTGEFALEGNVFLVEGEKYAIRERKKVKGKPKFYLIRCEPFQYVSSKCRLLSSVALRT